MNLFHSSTSACAVRLNWHHLDAQKKINAKVAPIQKDQNQAENTFRVMIEITNFFTNKINQNQLFNGKVDLVMSIYEVGDSDYKKAGGPGESPKQLCETFVIEGLNHSEAPIIKQSVLFEGKTKSIIEVLLTGHSRVCKKPEDIRPAPLFRVFRILDLNNCPNPNLGYFGYSWATRA